MTEANIKTAYKIFGVILVLLAAGAWFFMHPRLSFVDTVHPARGPAVQAVYATGTVEATVMLPIAARSMARLKELDADEGSSVAKGQVLAKLEDHDLQHALAELRAKAEFARKEYVRKAALAKEGYETKSVLDQARADSQAAEAAVGRAEAEAGFMTLAAPADGRIIRRDGEIGEMIAANQPVFWMSCCAPLRVSAEVDEEDIAQVKPKQDVLIRADAFPGKVFHGKVLSITPKGDPVARSYRVRVGFTEDNPLQIGMTAETNIVISTHDNAILLPSGAVPQNGKIWVVKNGRLAQERVSVGARGPEQIEILGGVTEKDEVVLKPDPQMAAGQAVRARLAD